VRGVLQQRVMAQLNRGGLLDVTRKSKVNRNCEFVTNT